MAKKNKKSTKKLTMKRQPGTRPIAHAGHGPLRSRKLTAPQLKHLKSDKFVNVSITMKGRRFNKRVTRANIKGGDKIEYYWRSDSKVVCLRNYRRDANLPKHGQTKYRPPTRHTKKGGGKIQGQLGDMSGERI